ncbi:tyrosine-type recombinase/integrase [Parvicella tangerina]|uniref:Tyrosine recombinase XerD n=1 Tax=Parvicella tangerina TaxID=2829795 RepID=A0A916JRD0_9FLAO|nr:tyrosine-type recombinase/integrase [Parvicella tangerina]CAG5087396.1 Tyrosine recombinase XerD [Parvicella tangerina]
MKTDKLMPKVEAYLRYFYSKETADSYQRMIVKFMEVYPNYINLKLADIEGYLLKLKTKGDSVNYRNVRLAAIKAFYSCLLDARLIHEHPCKYFYITEKRPTGKNFDALLSMDEMEVILSIRDERYSELGLRNLAIIGIMIYQGVTSKELIGLNLSDIDFDAGTIRIKGSKQTKGRVLELKTKQATVLSKYIKTDRVKLSVDNTKTLFLTMRGMRLTVDGLHGFITSMQGAVDPKLTPANIRNSVISYWLNDRKIPLEDVQVMAGHKYPSSTEKYINGGGSEHRNAVNELHAGIFG